MNTEFILKSLQWRYAVQMFDMQKPISKEELHTILEAGRLAPSSYGIEPWKFIVVENPALRTQLREASYGQSKVTDAPYIVVIAYRTDGENVGRARAEQVARVQHKNIQELTGLQEMIDNSAAAHAKAGTLDGWLKAQAYIPLGMMIETAALLGIDSGPMEGFSPAKVDELLGLSAQHLHATVMLALGHRGNDSAALRPKVRRAFDEVVEFVR